MIKEIDYGMAYRVKDIIYINKNLKLYPKLYKAIMKHEKEHSDDYSMNDLKMDLRGIYLDKVKKDYYLFFIRHPKALIHFIPFFKLDNKWTIDPLLLTMYILFIILLIITFSLIIL